MGTYDSTLGMNFFHFNGKLFNCTPFVDTKGAALIGLTLSSMYVIPSIIKKADVHYTVTNTRSLRLYGATLLQCFFYFTNYYNDSRTLKTTVRAVPAIPARYFD